MTDRMERALIRACARLGADATLTQLSAEVARSPRTVRGRLNDLVAGGYLVEQTVWVPAPDASQRAVAEARAWIGRAVGTP